MQIPCLIESCEGVPARRLIYRLLEVAITAVTLTGQVMACDYMPPRGEFSPHCSF